MGTSDAVTLKDILGWVATILAGPATALFIDALRRHSSRQLARFMDRLVQFRPPSQGYSMNTDPVNRAEYLSAHPRDVSLFDLAIAEGQLISIFGDDYFIKGRLQADNAVNRLRTSE